MRCLEWDWSVYGQLTAKCNRFVEKATCTGSVYQCPQKLTLQFIVSLITLPLAARYLEKLWGPKELIRFCFIVIAASNAIGFGLSWIEWFVLGNENFFL